ncbi:hypothetical protein PHLCEN_2v12397 [Hermanssonia centrifuga]|uniref:Uncharacterized protein n=1 Tax=Hermanssonia centrifuga TaxID=98765 RepID=A0A2R6NHC4_9APHY|nr:hypothetical protein PHLCEN_2v12397 [Hermanssonia centrifuga]
MIIFMKDALPEAFAYFSIAEPWILSEELQTTGRKLPYVLLNYDRGRLHYSGIKRPTGADYKRNMHDSGKGWHAKKIYIASRAEIPEEIYSTWGEQTSESENDKSGESVQDRPDIEKAKGMSSEATAYLTAIERKRKRTPLFAALDTTTDEEIEAGLEYSTHSKKIKGSATEGHIPSTTSDHEDIAGPSSQPTTPESNLTMIDLTSLADSHDSDEHTPTAADTTMEGTEAGEMITRTPSPGPLLPPATLPTAADDSPKVLKGFSNPYNKNRYLYRF